MEYGSLSGLGFLTCAVLSSGIYWFRWFSIGYAVRISLLFAQLRLVRASNGEPLVYWGVAVLWRRLKKRTGIDDKRVSVHIYSAVSGDNTASDGL